ncbi:FAD-dependent oxidoreductase [Sphingomonas sp. PR090111-T3T-6A]|uniref:FAD-dependent oxidoreductase n=1 Tax=Sphingomonas sp. PR090111-T3T-6A TaxID=685778 RepID=UPI00036B4396|nr:FAD-binding oxidoreductase [Sphingomonas sp. PR090111-T3T-6A]
MLRRNLLKLLGATAVSLPLDWRLARAAPGPVTSRVRPGEPSWPSEAAWKRLRQSVGGSLIKVEQLFASCAQQAESADCADLRKNLRNPFFLGDQPGGTQVSGWYRAWTPAPSAYAVKARTTADVAAAVNFARIHNLRLAVKGTGHSYQGTSSAPDSLLIWTRAMNSIELHDRFVPHGCDVAPVSAVSAGAGCMWIDLYHAVTTQAGRYVQGGGCTDVGVAGLVQSGGFGSFSKGFGTAASSLLEAEIVTADGVARICNARINPDLFWAIRGGGGGSWGVVTRITLRTHDLPENFGGAWGVIQARSDDAFKALIAHFLGFYRDHLLNPHWGEQFHLSPDNQLEISMVCQGLTGDEAQAVWKPFFDWVRQNPDLKAEGGLHAKVVPARGWWNVKDNPLFVPDDRPGAPPYHGWWTGDQGQVGAYLNGFDSLWLPAALLSPPDGLATALFEASRFKAVELHCNKGLAGAPEAARRSALDTATNPAVVNAFALALIADLQASAYPGERAPDLAAAEKDADAIAKASAKLRACAPDAGSYVSESNYFNPDWQNAYWGPNHARLAAIKAKYDPDGLFFVHNGVGSEGWSRDGFRRVPRR